MDTAQWPQGIGVVKPMEGSRPTATTTTTILERKVIRPQKDQALNCPRCNSTNTKFCYYNNYSLSQPRYFCKTCRRYWTEGGSLRNVPVGGGSRKNKRSSSTTTTTTNSSKKINIPDLITPLGVPHSASHQNPNNNNKIHDQGQGLNLSYPPSSTDNHQDYSNIPKFVEVPFKTHHLVNPSASPSKSSHHVAAMELLKNTTGMNPRGLDSFMTSMITDSNTTYSTGFSSLQEFKPTLSFSLEGFESSSNGGYGSIHGMQETGTARLLFPVEELKPVQGNGTQFEQNRGQADTTGFWNGIY